MLIHISLPPSTRINSCFFNLDFVHPRAKRIEINEILLYKLLGDLAKYDIIMLTGCSCVCFGCARDRSEWSGLRAGAQHQVAIGMCSPPNFYEWPPVSWPAHACKPVKHSFPDGMHHVTMISIFWFRDGFIWGGSWGNKWAGAAETNIAGHSGTQLQPCPLLQQSVLFCQLSGYVGSCWLYEGFWHADF